MVSYIYAAVLCIPQRKVAKDNASDSWRNFVTYDVVNCAFYNAFNSNTDYFLR